MPHPINSTLAHWTGHGAPLLSSRLFDSSLGRCLPRDLASCPSVVCKETLWGICWLPTWSECHHCSHSQQSALHCLQDDVPSFDDALAFSIMEEDLGRPLASVFSSISEHPIAAASLGQVRGWGYSGYPALTFACIWYIVQIWVHYG